MSGYPMAHTMTFQEAKRKADRLWELCGELSRAMDVFPRNSMGLASDATRATAEYREAKMALDVACTALRSFNAVYTKAFKAELTAGRKARRAANQGT